MVALKARSLTPRMRARQAHWPERAADMLALRPHSPSAQRPWLTKRSSLSTSVSSSLLTSHRQLLMGARARHVSRSVWPLRATGSVGSIVSNADVDGDAAPTTSTASTAIQQQHGQHGRRSMVLYGRCPSRLPLFNAHLLTVAGLLTNTQHERSSLKVSLIVCHHLVLLAFLVRLPIATVSARSVTSTTALT